jgi:hypothetical protein
MNRLQKRISGAGNLTGAKRKNRAIRYMSFSLRATRKYREEYH